jgi:hypothetical protein
MSDHVQEQIQQFIDKNPPCPECGSLDHDQCAVPVAVPVTSEPRCDYILPAKRMGYLIAQIGIAAIKLRSRGLEPVFCTQLEELESELIALVPTIYEVVA